MKCAKLIIVAGLALFPETGSTAELMSMKSVILYGLEHSPRVISSQAILDNARLELTNATARYYPTLDSDASVSSGLVTSPEFGRSGPTYNKTAGLTLNENLWDGGVRSLAKEAAKSRLSAAEIDFAQNRDQLALDLIKAYYEWAEISLSIKSHEEQQKILEKQASDIDEAFHHGLRIKRDVMNMQTELQRQELVMIAARDQAAQAREKLLMLMGADEHANFEFEVLNPIQTTGLSNVIVAAGMQIDVQDTTLVKHQKLDEESARLTIEAERRRKTWPTVDFSLGSSYRVNESSGNEAPKVFTRDGVNWSAAIGFRYNIWDWGIREREIGILINDQKRAAAERGQQFVEWRQKIANVKRAFGQAEKNLKLNTDLLKLEDESNAATTADFRRGRATYLEVIDTMQKLREAKLAHAKAYFDWLRNAWEYRFYAGGLFDVVQKL